MVLHGGLLEQHSNAVVSCVLCLAIFVSFTALNYQIFPVV